MLLHGQGSHLTAIENPSNAAPAGREHEDLEYTCILISEQFI
jgi:hypothetical protein